MSDTYTSSEKRQRTSITLPARLIAGAKEHDLNISRLAEEGINKALKEKMAAQWYEENRDAIAAYNKMVEEHGLLIDSDWVFKNE